MFGIEKTKANIPTKEIEKLAEGLGFNSKSVRYPFRHKDGTKEYVPVWELTEEYKKSQIAYHKNRIAESEYLLSLLT